MDLTFLPDWPLNLDHAALFAVLLLAGLAAGRVVAKTGFLPTISGYLAIGYLLGPKALDLIDASMRAGAQPFVDIAIALILFHLGRLLDLRWLQHDRWLLVMALAEALLSFGAVFGALSYLEVPALEAALVAAIGISTSPAVLLLVAQELKADGQLTRRALLLTAVNNVIALVVFTILLGFVHLDFGAGAATILLHSPYLLLGSALLSYACFVLVRALARWIGKGEAEQFLLAIGMVLLVVGCAHAFKLSVLLCALMLGIFWKNLDTRHELLHVDLGRASQLFYIVLFVIAGANMDFAAISVAGLAVIVFIVARFAAKAAAVYTVGRMNGLSAVQTLLLPMALLPMAVIGLGLTHTVTELHPGFGAQFSAIMAASVTLLDLIAPLAARAALIGAGEAQR